MVDPAVTRRVFTEAVDEDPFKDVSEFTFVENGEQLAEMIEDITVKSNHGPGIRVWGTAKDRGLGSLGFGFGV